MSLRQMKKEIQHNKYFARSSILNSLPWPMIEMSDQSPKQLQPDDPERRDPGPEDSQLALKVQILSMKSKGRSNLFWICLYLISVLAIVGVYMMNISENGGNYFDKHIFWIKIFLFLISMGLAAKLGIGEKYCPSVIRLLQRYSDEHGVEYHLKSNLVVFYSKVKFENVRVQLKK